MPNSSKKMINAKLMQEFEGIFRCPICSMPMKVDNLKSFICINRHCFDIARQGYINLLNHSAKTKYDKQLFQSRQIIFRNGFFEPLIRKISHRITKEINAGKPGIYKILDAGCGEGSHLSSIRERIVQGTEKDLLCVGVDISKEGILVASREYSNTIWCVADLAKCPFADQQFDFILNILSPANYTEFKRMLTDEGIVIKVLPEKDYLRELRDVFFNGTNKEDYSNESTFKSFTKHFDLLDIERVHYSITLEHTLIQHLVQMTPLSWGATEESRQKILNMDSAEVTIDLSILIGKKPKG